MEGPELETDPLPAVRAPDVLVPLGPLHSHNLNPTFHRIHLMNPSSSDASRRSHTSSFVRILIGTPTESRGRRPATGDIDRRDPPDSDPRDGYTWGHCARTRRARRPRSSFSVSRCRDARSGCFQWATSSIRHRIFRGCEYPRHARNPGSSRIPLPDDHPGELLCPFPCRASSRMIGTLHESPSPLTPRLRGGCPFAAFLGGSGGLRVV